MDSEMPYFFVDHYASSAWCIMQYTVLLRSCLLFFLCNPYTLSNLQDFMYIFSISLVFNMFFTLMLVEVNLNGI